MNEILTEKEYQHFIMKYLEKENGYVIRNAKTDYDPYHAMDPEIIMCFLEGTQPDEIKKLKRVYGDDLKNVIVNTINAEAIKKKSSILEVLKHGFMLNNTLLKMMYKKPASTLNDKTMALYQKNIFSVMEEVVISPKERIDLVIFLNGIAIMSFELKSNCAHQSVEDAMEQYRTDRDPKNRLFLFKAGCLVNFAMDLERVYMTTKLDGESTFFLPFNKGNGEGVNAGAGNPIAEDKESDTYYMWEDVLTKDSVLELLSKFIFVQYKEEYNPKTGKMKEKENIIFPRFHQRDVIHKTLDDVLLNGTSENYLIQHSAGSGKTNSIAWLAYRLSTLHDENNKVIFDHVIIVTDRVVVDRQLQSAIMGMEHQSGLIRVMDDKCHSIDLAKALTGKTKIIATTIQKFPFILKILEDENVTFNFKDKKFAIIIDEAHSSTAGKDMAAVTVTLSTNGESVVNEMTAEEKIVEAMSGRHKQNNISAFAFTATPKPSTISMFGRQNKHGQKEAFHIYSMKQAIEEGFILDVLKNYITYRTYYQINKDIQEDPRCKTNNAKRQIARFIELHDTNIAQRIEIIVEHFRTTVMSELGGQAKAMVVTNSREGAVKYQQAFKKYIHDKGYNNINALVAFSGTVKDKDGNEYTEAGMNGFSEDKLPTEFDSDEYKVLLVANKYQTGFDQPKLCAMYILKKLNGVNAVQTLSRLNRICPPYDKHVFVLDFVNTYEEIMGAFSTYYTTTLLSNSVTPSSIYDLEARIDGLCILDPDDIDDVSEMLYQATPPTPKEKRSVRAKVERAKKNMPKDEKEFTEAVMLFRKFVRFYEFLIQATCFEDVEIHKKYTFITLLLAYLDRRNPGAGYNLDGKLIALGVSQKKTGEHTSTNMRSDPLVQLATADKFNMTEEKEEKLSEIIEEVNAIAGKSYDSDVVMGAVQQIRDLLLKSSELKESAKNNTAQDFEFAYMDDVDNALVEGLSQNQDFFTLLLNNEDIKKRVLGIFSDDIYNSLRKAEG